MKLKSHFTNLVWSDLERSDLLISCHFGIKCIGDYYTLKCQLIIDLLLSFLFRYYEIYFQFSLMEEWLQKLSLFALYHNNCNHCHFQPKIIVSANCGVEPGKIVKYKPLLDGALQMISFRPHKCIIYNRPGVRI